MTRTSAFKGTWEENKRPYITIAPDAYITIQGQTNCITCGECNRKIDLNKYLTGINTDATVDSPPGGATINLSVPSTDVNDLFIDGNFVIIPMMEVEIFAKGYYTVGGLPQYYRIFWGVVVNVSKSWSNGVESFTLSCKDMLHWWEKTNITLNPAFTGAEGASTGYTLFNNQFSGMNPYAIIIALAKESMGDFSITDGSFMSEKPEAGPEKYVVGQYAKDVMAYWQLKFGNIWNSLVLYGMSGTAYSFEGVGMTVSPVQFAASIFQNEAAYVIENKLTKEFKLQPTEIAAFKVDYTQAGHVEFFQNDTQNKLSVAMTARDQIQYELYCDTTGDIIFKPPFYNLNVIPNKPVSWINDFEIIDDSINDSEQEVITHMTSSGNAFGGVNDYGLTNEITVPRTGVIDWHLLKRYGWRRHDFQCEWAGNPKKLFWFLIDFMDRVNAKRNNGTVTIPMRPEIRMGFPVWIPHYDSFYYVNGVSHIYSPGGQATTTLQLIAKRSKFVAPKNLGRIKRVPTKPSSTPSKDAKQNEDADDNQKVDATMVENSVLSRKNQMYEVSFEGHVGETAGLSNENQNDDEPSNVPLIIRDPNSGKILGYPNVVMVYRTTFAGKQVVKQTSGRGRAAAHAKKNEPDKPPQYKWKDTVGALYKQLQSDKRDAIVQRLRMNRYEAGMTNAGLYDYAVDESGDFKEMMLIPVSSVLWGTGSDNPMDLSGGIAGNNPNEGKKNNRRAPGGRRQQPAPEPPTADQERYDDRKSHYEKTKKELDEKLRGTTIQGRRNRNKDGLIDKQIAISKKRNAAEKDFLATVTRNHRGKKTVRPDKDQTRSDFEKYTTDELHKKTILDTLQEEYNKITEEIEKLKKELSELESGFTSLNISKNMNVSVRPVSDEYGFEVIGHNRYGRGVFVDGGRTRLNFSGREVNELRIQFAASGNMITNPPTGVKFGLEQDTFSEAFEKMKPEDWITGASSNVQGEVTLTSVNTYASAINHGIILDSQVGSVFIESDATKRARTIWELQPNLSSGLDEIGHASCNCKLSKIDWFSILPKSALQEILASGNTSYTSSNLYDLYEFKNVDIDTGVEVEEVREKIRDPGVMAPYDPARTFMSPDQLAQEGVYWGLPTESEKVTEVIPSKLVAVYVKRDPAGNILDSIEREVTNPNEKDKMPNQIEVKQDEDLYKDEDLYNTYSATTLSPLSSSQEFEAIKPRDFFEVLNEYLLNRFNENFKDNEERELMNTGIDLNVQIEQPLQNIYIDPDDVLGPSGGSLFDRASLGDPGALEALQNQASWEWSKSQEKLEELKKDYYEHARGHVEPVEQPQYGVAKPSGQPVGGPSTSSQFQPFTPSPVVIDGSKNPGDYDDAQETNHLGADLSIVDESLLVPGRPIDGSGQSV